MLVRGTTVVWPLDKGVGLADLRRLGDADGQVALGDRHGGDPHIGAHDDGAAGFLDHHAGDLVGLDPQLLDLAEQGDRVAPGQVQRHGARVGRRGQAAAGRAVDGGGDAPGRGQVRVAQRQAQAGPAGQGKGTSRSTMAPEAMRALVGTPRCTLAPAPRAATAPVATAPCATA